MINKNKEFTLTQELPFVTKASRYLGNEINSIHKNPAEVDITFAFAFPDAYEIGMSHTGMHILYEHLNSFGWIACERVFAPWVDMQERMRSHGQQLHTLENRLPVNQCDIVGFSLEYELASSTALRMLELAGIPLRATERDTSFPLIIAGGPCTYNPEPLADFIDAFVIGEGEEVSIELCDAVRTWKSAGTARDKIALLNRLSEIPGIYVPHFFKPTDTGDGYPQAVTACKPEYGTVTKRIIRDFTHAPSCTTPVVPYLQIVHDRAAVEIARGCTRGCRFCMAGMVYRPTREKTAETICSLARECLDASGYEELGLLSLSSSDHSAIEQVLPELMHQAQAEMIAVSLPSLRVDSLKPAMMDEIKKVRKTGFTIAPEAGTQRLRDVINKGITSEEILTTAQRIFEAGWNLVKLYFMIGLPTETDQDLDGIVDLARSIAKLNQRKQVTVSISTFVPKPHTPFQWESQNSVNEILRKQRYLMDRMRARNIQCKCHNHHLSMLEGVFARGDRRLGNLLLEAHKLGAGFESWSEHFKPELWAEAFSLAGIDPNAYLEARPIETALPWDHINCGVKKDFLTLERERAFAVQTTPDCRRSECQACGVCNDLNTNLEITTTAETAKQVHKEEPSAGVTADAIIARYRIKYAKTGPARFLSHLELTRVFSRALRRARLPLRFSSGFHPMPKITFHNALPVGLESEEEWCDMQLLSNIPPDTIFNSCASLFPEGITILDITAISLKDKTVPATIRSFRVTFPEHMPDIPHPKSVLANIEQFKNSEALPVEITRKKGTKTVNLKDIIQDLTSETGNQLMINLYPSTGFVPRIDEIIEIIFDVSGDIRAGLSITKLRT